MIMRSWLGRWRIAELEGYGKGGRGLSRRCLGEWAGGGDSFALYIMTTRGIRR